MFVTILEGVGEEGRRGRGGSRGNRGRYRGRNVATRSVGRRDSLRKVNEVSNSPRNGIV